MILPIYTYGQPVLRKVAQDITPDYPELPKLIEDMFETMYRSEGVGLAAPQIGKDIRVVVVTLHVLKDEYPEYADFNHAYINPHILEYDDSEMQTMDEGCLSLPGIHEPVKRPTRILVRWNEPDFTEREEWVDGYLARVLQHEIDHLEGKVFTDRITPLRKQMIRSKMNALVKGKFRCGYKTK